MLLRGEALRVGGRKDHNATQDLQVLRENLTAYKIHLFEPLQRAGYRVTCVADVMTDDLRVENTSGILHEILGDFIVPSRVTEFLRAIDQVNSVINSWDFFSFWVDRAKVLHTIVGVYVVRADVRLLREGPHTWPTEQLAFFWKTKWLEDPMHVTVNDILFFVPVRMFRTFRLALAQATTLENLHWLAEHPALKDHIWLHANMNHPSNTAKEQNPYYVITGRKQGLWQPGKWHQYELTMTGYDSLRKREVQSWSFEELMEIWRLRIIDLLHLSGGSMAISDFANLWSKEYPEDAIAWFKPHQSLKWSIVGSFGHGKESPVQVGHDGQSIHCSQAHWATHCRHSSQTLDSDASRPMPWRPMPWRPTPFDAFRPFGWSRDRSRSRSMMPWRPMLWRWRRPRHDSRG